MKCYHVVVHGRLDWADSLHPAEGDVVQPAGFYSHRHVLASTVQRAEEVALRKVRARLADRTDWLQTKAATLTLEAAEVSAAPFHQFLKPAGGFAFYSDA